MTEYDDSEFTEEELRYIKAAEREENKKKYRESRMEVLEFEAEIQAEQRGATIWQGVRQAAGLKSQEEFLQLQRTDPARANPGLDVAGAGARHQRRPEDDGHHHAGAGYYRRHPGVRGAGLGHRRQRQRDRGGHAARRLAVDSHAGRQIL